MQLSKSQAPLAKVNNIDYSVNMETNNMIEEITLKLLLTQNFLKWQNELGKIKTQKQFAEEVLDIHEVTYSRYYNEKNKPSRAVLAQLAEKTGDTRFYDLAELPHPDPDLALLKAIWQYIPNEQKRSLREQGETYAADNKGEKNG